ncbi:MAG: YeeE/YedE family protein [Bacteroidales bacterium]|nr:YeeE/YedE family protein [Bacteroidales bacterium]
MDKNKYLNPYIGGVLLGLVLVLANVVSGRGWAPAGPLKSVVVTGMEAVAPEHTENAAFYKEYKQSHSGHPMKNWLVFQVLGIVVGGLISGALAKRLNFKIEHVPTISSKHRLMFALVGGVLFGFGSQLGRGCTSGSALSGMAVLSLGGFVTMAGIFGTAFALAYFFRKNWIQ